MKKRLLSILLTCAMLLGMLPTVAFAAPGDTTKVTLSDAPAGLELTIVEPEADAEYVLVNARAYLVYTNSVDKGSDATSNPWYQEKPYNWCLDIKDTNTTALVERYVIYEVDPDGDPVWDTSESVKNKAGTDETSYKFTRMGSEEKGTHSSSSGNSTTPVLNEAKTEITWTMQLPVKAGQTNSFDLVWNHGEGEGGYDTDTFTVNVQKTPTLNIQLPESLASGDTIDVVVETDADYGSIALKYGNVDYTSVNVVDGQATFKNVVVQDGGVAMTATQTIEDTNTEALKLYTASATTTVNVSSNITVTMKDVDGTVLGTKYVISGHKLDILPAPTPAPAGCVFEGWYTWEDDDADDTIDADELTEFNFATSIDTATVLYAKWTDAHAVTFKVNGEQYGAVQYVADGDLATKPADPVVAGSAFVGWYVDVDKDGVADDEETTLYTFTENVTADVDLAAKFSTTATVTYKVIMANGTVADYKTVDNVAVGSYLFDHPTVSMANQTFDGWYTYTEASFDVADWGTDKFTAFSGGPINANIVLYGKLTAIPTEQTVKFVRQAADATATNWPVDITFTDTATGVKIPYQTPLRDGYTFQGWSADSNATAADDAYAANETVTAGVTLYAVWTQDLVNVTLANSGGTNVVEVKDVPVANIAKGSTVNFTVELSDAADPAALVVTANGVALNPVKGTGNVYHYSFVANANTEVAIGQVATRKYVVTLPVGENFDAEFTVGGSGTSTTVDHGGSYTFTVVPVPADEYVINAVYVNGVKQNATSTDDTTKTEIYTVNNVTSDQTITIDMEKIVFHTITYVVDGAKITERQVQDKTAIPADVEAPDKTGYTFDGWYADKAYTSKVDDTTTATEDDEVYGRYVAQTGTIAYDANGGAFAGTAPTTTKTYGQAAILTSEVPTREGYTFLGWAHDKAATIAAYTPSATYSTEITPPNGTVTLYAVWQKNTFNVLLPTGTGYSINAAGSTTVEWDGSFTFTVLVDAAYAETVPTVSINTGALATLGTATVGNATATGAIPYTYTISNIKSDVAVSVTVVSNAVYDITFVYDTNDDKTPDGDTYLTQQVGYHEKVTQPAAPQIDGYTLDGWYLSDDSEYSFDTLVIADTTIYVKLTRNIYDVVIPADGTGWTVNFVTDPATTNSAAAQTITVDHGTDVKFQITIAEGYDASKMQVAANGVALAPIEIDGNEYTFLVSKVTADTNITVVGVVRKTVTITYNANARDDVSGMPEQQVVKYYLASAGNDNDVIVKQYPVRTGYEFLGWSTNSEATTPDTGYDKASIAGTPGAYAKFTENTTLYAVWEAEDLTIKLTFTGEYLNYGSSTSKYGTLDYFYEGDSITLVGTLSTGANGTMTFYKKLREAAEWTTVGSTTVSGGTVGTVTTAVEPYAWGSAEDDSTTKYNYRWDYKVEFTPDKDEGFEACEDTDDVRVYSKAISWDLDKKSDTTKWTIAENANVLTIYEDVTGVPATTPYTGTMKANTVYWLEIPTVKELDGGRALKRVQDSVTVAELTVGEHYVVEWQYKDAKNDWVTYTTITNSGMVKIDAEYSQYSFRALVKPATSGIYTKAAKYDDGTVIADAYMEYLITEPTTAVDLKDTVTSLEITGADEENAVKIGEATVTTGLAQFEGQNVTLKAKVTEMADGTTPVTGYVNFYRADGTKLNDTLVALDANGEATFAVAVKAYDSDEEVTDNVDQFYAEYVTSETWNTSTSKGDDENNPVYATVYIKSTTIQTPVITSVLEGKVNGVDEKTETTYTYDLTDLLAGVEHTFILKTGNSSADWSVVALDGREVAADNYTIQWNVKTGDNTTTDNTVGGTFVTSNNKVGDEIYVTLVPKGDMTVGADSKKAIIGTKQDVNVTVVASDEIKSTDDTDAYQLDVVTLTATVVAAEINATMQPTGTVEFYYSVDGNTWVKVGETTDLSVVAGAVTASIQTDKLPVAATTNTKQDIMITAIYSGDETFNAITEQADTKITQDEITIYSSVVYVNADVENKTVTPAKEHTNGIYIWVNDGALNANETNVTLKLSNVYTLDHAIDLSKLAYGTDYTVQWQILANAAAYSDKAAADVPWTNIDGETSTTCAIQVAQGAAYRAVITVKDTDIAKGSYTMVDQNIDGRQVYYSNILVAGEGAATVTVTTNTSNTADGYEGIVEGETVTIHTFVSGATNTTPISEMTVTVTDESATEVFKEVKYNVNGHMPFDWTTSAPGIYTLTVTAESTNGYDPKTITRTLIVRDDNYSFTASNATVTYNGKAQGLTVTVDDMYTSFSALAQKSVVVYYYDANGVQVEPTQAGTYKAVIRLQESAYWTEKTLETTFTIAKRTVNVVDLVAQTKVYDGTTDINELEIVLGDSAVNANGVATGTTGIINGDSIYATGVMTIDEAAAGEQTLSVSNVALLGDDAANYTIGSTSYTETINVQRNQVKGDIANATYKYGTTKVPADDIYLIDQAGTVITDYEVIYYYHSGDGVKKVDAMNWKGMYTVIARPADQDNYKGGASETIYVADAAVDAAPEKTAKSALIDITNTVELYGATTGVKADVTSGTVSTVEYSVAGAWTTTAPTAAGRYLVKVTTDTNDTAYGIYTVVKANPVLSLTAADADYTSAQITGTPVLTGAPDGAEVYYTWIGGTIQGVSYTAPTEVGTYVVTAHVGETDNYTAHEVSAIYTIKPASLTITADSWQRAQYGAFPDMTATFTGLAIGGVAPDTSLRDVQIQPEFIFNGTEGYSNNAQDQVGTYPVAPVSALARNYTVSYVAGQYTVTRVDANPELAIHGMISNGDGDKTIAYYGDKIQLYPYGSQKNSVINNSSIWTWSVNNPAIATISPEGLLEITGVGTVVVTLTRGQGTQAISTTLTIDARKQEVKVEVPSLNLVYNARERSYTSNRKFAAVDAMGKTVIEKNNSQFIADNTKRTDVGSQVVTGKVLETADYYQSETYGGLFTINDKEATVTPGAQTTVYGTKEAYEAEKYTVTGKAGTVDPVTNVNVATVTDAYANLDVYAKYEILVAGTENKNYNVKYVTANTAPTAEVTAKALTVQTGVINSDGRTSGYMENDNLYFEDAGYKISGTTFNGTPNDRMYGEINPVMTHVINGLIPGDSMADLKSILDWLVKYSSDELHNINGDANVKFVDAHLTGTRSTDYLSGESAYVIDNMLAANGMVNYDINSITEATQNIYQRPVTLTPRVVLNAYYADILDGGSVKEDALLKLILNNMIVGKYNGEGGLATLLNHTIEDLDIKLTNVKYENDKITATLVLGNTNYWLDPIDANIEVVVVKSKIEAVYGTLGKQSSSVTMYNVGEDGTRTTPVDVKGDVYYLIYNYDSNDNGEGYGYYKNLTPIRNVKMTKGSGTGVYVANYTALPAGPYVMFAIAEGYTIIE